VKGYEDIKKQLEQNSAVIRNKIDTIEKLIRDRDFATKSLMTLAQSMPKEMWITEYSSMEKSYRVAGSSLDAGLISDLMGKLQKSIYYTNVQLMSSSSTDGQGMKADFSLQGKVE
jgi:Tfp pilus assembly protein PilN